MELIVEQWGLVARRPGYKVSDHGRVCSLDRLIIDCNGRKIRRRGVMFKEHLDSEGRPVVQLGRGHFAFVHHLVLETFVGPRPPDTECCHWDRNKRNNYVLNLRWDTGGANSLDQVRHGSHWGATKTVCPFEHSLFPPNLVKTATGNRQCLACARARANQQYAIKMNRPFDLHFHADRHYAEITLTGGLALTPS